MPSAPTNPALVRRSWRLPASAVVVVCVVMTVVLGVRYRGSDEPGRLDAFLDPTLMVSSPTAWRFLSVLVFLGSPPVVALLIGCLALWAAVHRRWSVVALAVLAPGIAAVGTEFVLKPLVGRTLDGDLAFPSGHAVRVAAVAAVMLLLLAGSRSSRHRQLRVAAAVVTVVVTAAAAYSLIGLTWHYTTDVVGGVLVAVAVVTASALVIDVLSRTAAARPGRGTGARTS